MWRIWLMFDPRRLMIALALMLAALALLIHFILLSTNKYNWIEGSKAKSVAVQMAPTPAQK
jgi:light-harvesting complex 1 alpha chain